MIYPKPYSIYLRGAIISIPGSLPIWTASATQSNILCFELSAWGLLFLGLGFGSRTFPTCMFLLGAHRAN